LKNKRELNRLKPIIEKPDLFITCATVEKFGTEQMDGSSRGGYIILRQRVEVRHLDGEESVVIMYSRAEEHRLLLVQQECHA
jgi:hypothetical protein